MKQYVERDLEVLLSYLLNKQLKSSEVIMALGISRSAYYDQKERGNLASCNNLISAATHFGLNPLDLLVPYGHVTPSDVEEYCQRIHTLDPIPPTNQKGGNDNRPKPIHHLGPPI